MRVIYVGNVGEFRKQTMLNILKELDEKCFETTELR